MKSPLDHLHVYLLHLDFRFDNHLEVLKLAFLVDDLEFLELAFLDYDFDNLELLELAFLDGLEFPKLAPEFLELVFFV